MSQTYIPGIVDNIKSDSTPYSPIIEAITNSIDAINESGRTDGRIDITVERENVLPSAKDDELPEIISVQVSDNGIGFNPDYAHQIFGLFKRLNDKNQYAGSGIGLSLCKKVVINHGGAIEATGKEGLGAQFYIYLPKHQPQN